MSQLSDRTLTELVTEYARAAAQAGRVDSHSRRQNRAARQVAAIDRELRDRGEQRALLPLLENDDAGVRGWAACHALEFAPDRAIAVLEAAVSEPFPHGFTAEIVLKEWRAGRLRFP